MQHCSFNVGSNENTTEVPTSWYPSFNLLSGIVNISYAILNSSCILHTSQVTPNLRNKPAPKDANLLGTFLPFPKFATKKIRGTIPFPREIHTIHTYILEILECVLSISEWHMNHMGLAPNL